ncbi:TMEM175 family protein [Acidiphilium acidophilum]|uniref:TMEM175 family protein n=1 Tax=Acidiphilium acidophilum TaxID=76588 RepID=UPI002E8E761D|nr:TMEM175 family protein [Acidiphilium acidophilum]
MEKDRLTAFSDGVIAVIITIMVLDLKLPHGTSLAALATAAPTFVSYILSFIYVAIYWNNHHHFFQLVPRVTGAILWANLHLLFWLSLIPFATAWVGTHHTAAIPTALYGAALLMPALAWFTLQTTIIRAQGTGSPLAKAIGRDLKGKTSPLLYTTGILLAFINTTLADGTYALVALLWLIPDRRVEQALPDED